MVMIKIIKYHHSISGQKLQKKYIYILNTFQFFFIQNYPSQGKKVFTISCRIKYCTKWSIHVYPKYYSFYVNRAERSIRVDLGTQSGTIPWHHTLAPNMAPQLGTQHGTIAWHSAWHHTLASNMAPQLGTIPWHPACHHSSLQYPQSYQFGHGGKKRWLHEQKLLCVQLGTSGVKCVSSNNTTR